MHKKLDKRLEQMLKSIFRWIEGSPFRFLRGKISGTNTQATPDCAACNNYGKQGKGN